MNTFVPPLYVYTWRIYIFVGYLFETFKYMPCPRHQLADPSPSLHKWPICSKKNVLPKICLKNLQIFQKIFFESLNFFFFLKNLYCCMCFDSELIFSCQIIENYFNQFNELEYKSSKSLLWC